MADMDKNTLAVAGALAVGGVALVAYALTRQGGYGGYGLTPVVPYLNHKFGKPYDEELQGLTEPVPLGDPIAITRPMVLYQGSGIDTYTFLRILQVQGGATYTVYGSGLAGIHLQEATSQTLMQLVAEDQIQPDGTQAPILAAYPYPGVGPNPLCDGAEPRLGLAWALIEIYLKRDPADGFDGFSAPLCNARRPVARSIKYLKFSFV